MKYLKRVWILAIAFCLMLVFSPAVLAANGVWTGDGSLQTPYLIEDAADLAVLSNNVNSGEKYTNKYFRLTADIDLADLEGKTLIADYDTDGWKPIGHVEPIYDGKHNYFAGIFDGRGKVVKGLWIDRNDEYNVGLFGYVNDAIIINLGVETDAAKGGVVGDSGVGIFVGWSLHSRIVKCYTTGQVSGKGSIGGFAGKNEHSDIERCHTNANVVGAGTDSGVIGGFAGYNLGTNATIKNCYATGNVSGYNQVGGFVGQNSVDTFIQYCYSTGLVTGTSNTGGFVGWNSYRIQYCHYDKEKSQQAAAAGALGGSTYLINDITPQTTADMQLEDTYSSGLEASHWDFVSAWTLYPGGCPVLQEKTVYFITFESNGGSTCDIQLVCNGEKVEKPYSFRMGHEIQGWYSRPDFSGNAFNFDTNLVNGSFTLYAKWDIVVKFNSNGGSTVNSQQVEYGGKATEPADPTKNGYVFKGWYSDVGLTTPYDFDTLVTGPFTLYAKWDIIVTFNSNGGSTVDSQQVEYEGKATKPADPTKDGYAFVGWYSNVGLTTPYNFETLVKSPITLYAKWDIIVTFNSNGGSNVPSQQVEYEGKTTEPAEPTKEGYVFKGWHSDAGLTTLYDFDTLVKSPIILYAKWELKEYTVMFNSNGGSNVPSQQVKHGAQVAEPIEPTKEGYDFVAWYSDVELNNRYSFFLVLEGPLTLYAKWELKQYTVTFESNGGSNVPSQQVGHGSMATKPDPAPTKAGCRFVDWYDAPDLKTPYDFNAQVTNATTLYAKWKAISNTSDTDKTITFESNGGSEVELQTVEYGGKVTEPADPIKEGYVFTGWYSDADLTTLFDMENAAVTENITLYAGWLALEEVYLELPYISGYPDGSFAPERAITRAEMVQILYNVFGKKAVADTSILTSYSDMDSSHWAANVVAWAIENKYLYGYPDNTIQADQTITRGELTVLLCRIDTEYELTSQMPDVAYDLRDIADHWAVAEIEAMAAKGIVKGYSDNTFRPDDSTTRAEAVVFISRLLGRSESFTPDKEFTDVEEDHWAYDVIMNALNGLKKTQ